MGSSGIFPELDNPVWLPPGNSFTSKSEVKRLCNKFCDIWNDSRGPHPSTKISEFDSIVPHLDPHKIPSASSGFGQREFDAISLAMSAVRALAAFTHHRHRDRYKAVIPKVQRLFPNFWRWAEYLLGFFTERCSLGEAAAMECLEKIGRILGNLLDVNDAELQRTIMKTPDLLQTVTHYWLLEEHFGRFDGLEMYTVVLANLLRAADESDLDTILYASNGRKQLAQTAVRRLHGAVMRTPNDRACIIYNHLTVIQHLYKDGRSAMATLLLLAGLVPTVCRYLGVVPTHAPSDPIIGSVALCYGFIQYASHGRPDSRRWALEALHSGVVPASFRSAEVFLNLPSPSSAAVLFGFMDRLLKPHLVYRHFIGIATKHLRLPMDSVKRMSPRVREAWDAFNRMVQDRIETKRLFDTRLLRECHQCKNSVSNPSTRLKWCAGCRGTLYCSATCQRMHWPAHRVSCLAHREEHSHPDQGLTLSGYEHNFLLFVAEREVHHRSENIRKYLAGGKPTLRMEDLSFKLDFTGSIAHFEINEITSDSKKVVKRGRPPSEDGTGHPKRSLVYIAIQQGDADLQVKGYIVAPGVHTQ